MKKKLLYLKIGVLIGVVVMQWTMPSNRLGNKPALASVVVHETRVLSP